MGRTAVGRNIVALMLQEYERFTKSEKKIVDYVPVSYTHLTLPTNSRV